MQLRRTYLIALGFFALLTFSYAQQTTPNSPAPTTPGTGTPAPTTPDQSNGNGSATNNPPANVGGNPNPSPPANGSEVSPVSTNSLQDYQFNNSYDLPFIGTPSISGLIRRPGPAPYRFGMDLFIPARARINSLRQPSVPPSLINSLSNPISNGTNPSASLSGSNQLNIQGAPIVNNRQNNENALNLNGGANPTNPSTTTNPNGGANPTNPSGSTNANIPNGGANPTNPSGSTNANIPNGGANPTIPNGGANALTQTGGDISLNPTSETNAINSIGGALPTNPIGGASATGSGSPYLPSSEDMMNLFLGTGRTTILPTYSLARGDKITIHYHSPYITEQSVDLYVDNLGRVWIPNVGPILAAGITIQQFENAAQTTMRRYYKDVAVSVELTELHNIRVFVSGEAYQPGPQIVPATTTLFSLLYLVGGPSDSGTLRNIKLMRNGKTTTIDLYKYLINGDSSQDVPLQEGDTVLFSLIGRSVTVRGEVKRPAIFELTQGENILKALAYAGKLTPDARADRVQIYTIQQNLGPTLKDIDLNDESKVEGENLKDGDILLVSPIRTEPVDVVAIQGPVDLEGAYQFEEGMKVSDLVKKAGGLRGEVYMDRADLYRLDDQLRSVLYPINLKQAMDGDTSADMLLKRQDHLIVYTMQQAEWIAHRIVYIQGAVQRPGFYERPIKEDGFRIKDLLMLAGGPLPDADLDSAVIMRPSFSADPPKFIKVNLNLASQGDADHNIVLIGGDVLKVYTKEEAKFTTAHVITLQGAVLREGIYTRGEGMRVSDLLLQAGGVNLDAYLDRATLTRQQYGGDPPLLMYFNLGQALNGDNSQNLVLNDKDTIRIYTKSEINYTPEHSIRIAGEVQRPGVYPRTANLKLKDLIYLAGGLTPQASQSAEIAIPQPDNNTKILTADIALLNQPNGASQNPDLIDGSVVTIPSVSPEKMQVRIVYIGGSVAHPGPYALSNANDRISDLIKRAGGLTEDAYPAGSRLTRARENLLFKGQDDQLKFIANLIDKDNSELYDRLRGRAVAEERHFEFSQNNNSTPTIIPTGSSSSSSSTDAAILSSSSNKGNTTFTPTNVSDLERLAGLLVSQPESLSLAQQSSLVVADLNDALRNPNSPSNISLEDGDSLIVPETPTTVSVYGAVIQPGVLRWQNGLSVEDWIKSVGGLRRNADKQRLLVAHLNGRIDVVNHKSKVNPGDIIVVPTEPEAIRPGVSEQKTKDTQNLLLNTAVTLGVLKLLLF